MIDAAINTTKPLELPPNTTLPIGVSSIVLGVVRQATPIPFVYVTALQKVASSSISFVGSKVRSTHAS